MIIGECNSKSDVADRGARSFVGEEDRSTVIGSNRQDKHKQVAQKE